MRQPESVHNPSSLPQTHLAMDTTMPLRWRFFTAAEVSAPDFRPTDADQYWCEQCMEWHYCGWLYSGGYFLSATYRTRRPIPEQAPVLPAIFVPAEEEV